MFLISAWIIHGHGLSIRLGRVGSNRIKVIFIAGRFLHGVIEDCVSAFRIVHGELYTPCLCDHRGHVAKNNYIGVHPYRQYVCLIVDRHRHIGAHPRPKRSASRRHRKPVLQGCGCPSNAASPRIRHRVYRVRWAERTAGMSTRIQSRLGRHFQIIGRHGADHHIIKRPWSHPTPLLLSCRQRKRIVRPWAAMGIGKDTYVQV